LLEGITLFRYSGFKFETPPPSPARVVARKELVNIMTVDRFVILNSSVVKDDADRAPTFNLWVLTYLASRELVKACPVLNMGTNKDPSRIQIWPVLARDDKGIVLGLKKFPVISALILPKGI
jgi:hypothetical protein